MGQSCLTAPKSDFSFTPESGLKSDIAPCLKSANMRHRTGRLAKKKRPPNGGLQFRFDDLVSGEGVALILSMIC
jgi:hypothetical protein